MSEYISHILTHDKYILLFAKKKQVILLPRFFSTFSSSSTCPRFLEKNYMQRFRTGFSSSFQMYILLQGYKFISIVCNRFQKDHSKRVKIVFFLYHFSDNIFKNHSTEPVKNRPGKPQFLQNN